MKTIDQIIVEVARGYIGINEIPGNMGWNDGEFQTKMEGVGWNHGQAYCAYFTELVWKQAYKEYNPVWINTLDALFSAGALNTYNNFLKDPEFNVDKHCSIGAIAIWQYYQNGVATWKGHAGIVTENVFEHEFHTIEANTNISGSRDGGTIAPKVRLLNFDSKNNLVLRGFIHPIA